MNFIAAWRRAYHSLVPLPVRRQLRLSRWTASRRARSRLWRKTDGCVAAGPFAGLRLIAASPGDCEAPVLLGSFECETHAWLEGEFARGWSTAVNIGSHNGFYSTGLALRLPAASIHAFEMDPGFREETRRSAEANDVAARVQVLGRADIDALAHLPVPGDGGALVVCDCEGAERDILDPARVPWLVRSALCIELHDFAAAGATEVLLGRFQDTHELAIVTQAPRDAGEWASRAGIAMEDAALMCDEVRRWDTTTMMGRWLHATPRHRPGAR